MSPLHRPPLPTLQTLPPCLYFSSLEPPKPNTPSPSPFTPTFSLYLHFHKSMAQKRDKEETELKLPNSLSVCVPAIPISPQLSVPDDQTKAVNPPAGGRPRSPDPADPHADDSRSGAARSPVAEVAEEKADRSLKRPREVNRCTGNGCRRKVGLIGFRCRCGEVFCSVHRYSDRHDCTYDYKAAGRDAIARENPVVRAAKILKV